MMDGSSLFATNRRKALLESLLPEIENVYFYSYVRIPGEYNLTFVINRNKKSEKRIKTLYGNGEIKRGEKKKKWIELGGQEEKREKSKKTKH